MKIIADYHLHTYYSGDGKSSLKQILEMARKKGLRTVAITDHGPRHFLYGISRKNTEKLREEIRRARQEYPDIEILMGVEANISAKGEIDVNPEEYDWVNAGYHFASFFWINLKMNVYNFLARWFEGFRRKAIEMNTFALATAVERYRIAMLTHPGDKGDIDVLRVAKACEARGTIMEVNSAHKRLSVEQLKEVAEMDLKFAACSDAHRPERVGEVQRALDYIAASGIDVRKVVNVE